MGAVGRSIFYGAGNHVSYLTINQWALLSLDGWLVVLAYRGAAVLGAVVGADDGAAEEVVRPALVQHGGDLAQSHCGVAQTNAHKTKRCTRRFECEEEEDDEKTTRTHRFND